MYTVQQIREALEGYWLRIERVTEVLRLAPLNPIGIYDLVHASTDFLAVQNLHQATVGGALVGTVQDVLHVCREQYLQNNPGSLPDVDLCPVFADTALKAQQRPFFLVGYDPEMMAYVTKHVRLEREFPQTRVLRTARGVPFYLASEVEVNNKIPLRVRMGADLSLVLVDPS